MTAIARVIECTLSERGFKQMDEIVTDRDEHVRVFESSAAAAPYIWASIRVGPDAPYDFKPILAMLALPAPKDGS